MRTFLAEHANDRPGVLIPSFGVLADAWLEEKERSIQATTLRSYRSIVERDLVPRWGRKRADAITKRDVQTYRDEVSRRGVAPNTLNQYRARCGNDGERGGQTDEDLRIDTVLLDSERRPPGYLRPDGPC